MVDIESGSEAVGEEHDLQSSEKAEMPQESRPPRPTIDIRPQSLEDAINQTVLDSPHLPDNFQPLDYELLEYMDVLPPHLIERLARELKARESLVARLRASNDRLATLAHESSSSRAPRRSCPPSEEPPVPAEEDVQALEAQARAEALRASEAMERAAKLQVEICAAEDIAKAELNRIASRAEAAENRHCQFYTADEKERDDSRLQLRESQHKLQRLEDRAAQLARTLEQAERRTQQRDQELSLLNADREQLEREVKQLRAQTSTCEKLESEEQELRDVLRDAKAELRQLSKLQAHAPHRSSSSSMQPRICSAEVPRQGHRTGAVQQAQGPQRSSSRLQPRSSCSAEVPRQTCRTGTPQQAHGPQRSSSRSQPRSSCSAEVPRQCYRACVAQQARTSTPQRFASGPPRTRLIQHPPIATGAALCHSFDAQAEVCSAASSRTVSRQRSSSLQSREESVPSLLKATQSTAAKEKPRHAASVERIRRTLPIGGAASHNASKEIGKQEFESDSFLGCDRAERSAIMAAASPLRTNGYPAARAAA